MLGVDYIIPDMTHLRQHRSRCGQRQHAWSRDHIGAIRHLLEDVQAPVYVPLNRGLLEVKLARGGLAVR